MIIRQHDTHTHTNTPDVYNQTDQNGERCRHQWVVLLLICQQKLKTKTLESGNKTYIAENVKFVQRPKKGSSNVSNGANRFQCKHSPSTISLCNYNNVVIVNDDRYKAKQFMMRMTTTTTTTTTTTNRLLGSIYIPKRLKMINTDGGHCLITKNVETTSKVNACYMFKKRERKRMCEKMDSTQRSIVKSINQLINW